MQIQITLTADSSEEAADIIEALNGIGAKPVKAAPKRAAATPADDDEDEAPAPRRAPAKKAAPAKATPADEDEQGDPLSEAVAAATALVSSGKAAKVKEALGEVGAKRVSELTAKNVGKFLELLAEDDDVL